MTRVRSRVKRGVVLRQSPAAGLAARAWCEGLAQGQPRAVTSAHETRRRDGPRGGHAARQRRALRPGRPRSRAGAGSTGSARSTPSEFPVRVAAEVKDFEPPTDVVSAEGGAPARPQRPARARGREGGARRRRAERLRPEPRRDRLRLGDRRLPRDHGAGRRDAGARGRPGLAALPAQRPRRLRQRPARDLARDQGPELRGRLRLRDRLARGRRGRPS